MFSRRFLCHPSVLVFGLGRTVDQDLLPAFTVLVGVVGLLGPGDSPHVYLAVPKAYCSLLNLPGITAVMTAVLTAVMQIVFCLLRLPPVLGFVALLLSSCFDLDPQLAALGGELLGLFDDPLLGCGDPFDHC